MSEGAEVADQVVQEGIQVTESAAKLAGLGVKNLAIILLQLLQDNKKLKGKTGLNSLLQTNKPLVTFTMEKSALPEFKEKAEDYGVLFSSVHKSGKDGRCDIMVKADDASIVHRIFETMQQPAVPTRESGEGRATQNLFHQAVERLTDPARRLEGKTGPLEGLGAETLAALVYQLAAENRQYVEASPLSRIFEADKGLQFTEGPDYCRQAVLEKAEVLDIPLHIQSSQTPGKVTLMAKSEDVALVNRLFENMGLEKPMQEAGAQRAQPAAAEKAQPAVVALSKGEPPIPDKDGRASARIEFSKAQAQAKSGKSPVATAHKAAQKAKPAKAAAR